MNPSQATREPVLVDLALQSGGSHGAFTWGVLDRLLEEPWLRIAAISGTSAGAMNAAVLSDGWTKGGAEGARAANAIDGETYWDGGFAGNPTITPLIRELAQVLYNALAGLLQYL